MVGPPRNGFQGFVSPNNSTDKQSFGSSFGTSTSLPSTKLRVQPTVATFFGTHPASPFGSNSNVFGSKSGTVSHNFGSPSPAKGTPFVHGEASTHGFGFSSNLPSLFGSNVFGTPSNPSTGTSTAPSLFGSNVFGSNSGTFGHNFASSSPATGTPFVHGEASMHGFGWYSSTPANATSTTPVSNSLTVGENVGSSNPVPGIPLVHGGASVRSIQCSSSFGESTTASAYDNNVFSSNSENSRQNFGSSSPLTGTAFAQGAASAPLYGFSYTPDIGASTTPASTPSATPKFGFLPTPDVGWSPPASLCQPTSQRTASQSLCRGWNTFGEQQGGSSICSYSPTINAEENSKFMSISAMSAYHDKSHEEIRLEDYQQQRNNGPVVSNNSNGQPSPKSLNSTWFDPFEQHHSNRLQAFNNNVPNGQPSQSNIPNKQPSQSNIPNKQPSQTDVSSLFPGFQVPYLPAYNFANCSPFGQSTSASHFSATSTSVPPSESLGFGRFSCKCNQPNPFAQPIPMVHTTATRQTCTQPFSLYSFPAFVTFIQPTTLVAPAQQSSLFVPTVASLTPLLGTHISPATVSLAGPTTNSIGFNIPNGVHSTPGFYHYEAPVVALGGPNGSNEAPVVALGGSNGAPNTSFVGINSSYTCKNPNEARSIAPLVSSFTSPSSQQFQSLSNTIEFSSFPCYETVAAHNGNENDEACHVPKALEVIVEKLGFNPFSQGKDNAAAKKHDSEKEVEFLPCEEAEKDDDIIALAEFAVEQHNALHKDEEVSFVKVLAACLEAVGGGRYHIVVEALVAGTPKKHYAVVLRKSTERPNHLTVLEKWLPSQA